MNRKVNMQITRHHAQIALEGIGISVAVMIGMLFLERELTVATGSALFLGIAWSGLRIFLPAYQQEQEKRVQESFVADFLLQASLFPGETSVEEIIAFYAKQNNALGELFLQTGKEIQVHHEVKKALHAMQKRIHSKKIALLIESLLVVHESGSDFKETLKEIAEDMIEKEVLVKERKATQAIQKYTVMAAAGFFVPLIMGIVFAVVQGLQAFNGQGSAMQEVMRVAAPLYLIEFSILSAWFLAFLENNNKKTVLYAFALAPLGLLVFFLAQKMF